LHVIISQFVSSRTPGLLIDHGYQVTSKDVSISSHTFRPNASSSISAAGML
jgi:hypothetical protein